MTRQKLSQEQAKALYLEAIELHAVLCEQIRLYSFRPHRYARLINRAYLRFQRRSDIYFKFQEYLQFLESLQDSELAQPLESVPKVQGATSPDTCPNCEGYGSTYLSATEREECPLCCGSGEYTPDYEAHYQSIRAVPYVVPVNPDWLQD